jgi:hypothetical protein
MKTAGEIIDLDTSRGCIGYCPSCYSATGPKKLCFIDPQPVKLTGGFNKNPQGIYRVGTNGEPNFNPNRWKAFRENYIDMVKSNDFTQAQLDELIDQTYDWTYTNHQLINSNLVTPGRFDGNKYIPGGRDQTFIITKLQSLDGFNPDLIRNLEVSIDPMMPSHFFKSLKNIETLKATHPEVNVQLRIRSAATYSDEINSLQKMAVDFANKNDLEVLETRLRFKKADTMVKTQVLPEYYPAVKFKHVSYYPTIQEKLGKMEFPGGKKPREVAVKTFEVHGPDGPNSTSTYIKTTLSPKGKAPGESQKKWEVWSDGKRVAARRDLNTAVAIGRKQVQNELGDLAPSKIVVRQYSVEESPLSQFGLDPKLHKQCNVFNMSGAACAECQSCRAFIETGKTKGIENNFK